MWSLSYKEEKTSFTQKSVTTIYVINFTDDNDEAMKG